MGLPHEKLVSEEDGGDERVGSGGGESESQGCRRDHRKVGVSASGDRDLLVKNVRDTETTGGNDIVEFCECGIRNEKKSVSPTQLYGSKRGLGSEERVWAFPSVIVSSGGCSRDGAEVEHQNTHTPGRSLKTFQRARAPSSVIVGFDSHGFTPKSIPSSSTPKAAYAVTPAVSDINFQDCLGSVVRRKTSSPLASMLSSDRSAGTLEFSFEENAPGVGRREIEDISDSVDHCVLSSNNPTSSDERLVLKEKGIPIEVPSTFVRDQVPITKERSYPVRVPAVLIRDGNPFSDEVMNSVRIPKAFGWAGIQAVTEETDGPVLAPWRGSSAKQSQPPGNNSSVITEKTFSERPLDKLRPRTIECNSRWSPSPRPCLAPALSFSPLGPKWALPSKGDDNVQCKFWESGTDSISPPRPRLRTWPGAFVTSQGAELQCEVQGHSADTLHEQTGDHCKYFLPGTPHKQGASWSGPAWGLEATSAPAVVGMRSSSASTGPPIRRSLVGSFEESLLAGRFLSEKPCQKLDGFLALLTVTGAGRSAPSRKLPFSVTCVDGDSSLLYYASIDISGSLAGSKLTSSKPSAVESRRGNSRFRVPAQGRVQLVLSNPEKTPVHTFICSYDLSDMPPGTKTFMRHKVSLAGSSPRLSKHNCSSRGNSKIVSEAFSENAPSCQKCGFPNYGERVYSNSIRLEQDRDMSSHIVKTDSSLSMNVQGSHLRCGCFGNCEHRPKLIETTGRMFRNSIEYAKHRDGCKGESEDGHLQKGSRDESQLHDGIVRMRDAGNPSVSTPDAPAEQLSINSEVKCLESAGSVLRYALHLRFMCPPLKQSKREGSTGVALEPVLESKADSPSGMHKRCNNNDERRFYIYGDLRVVFPQRQSDSDEGMLHVDYDFPSNPKYFESNC